MTTPCRLFVILARSTPAGVILRRGPTEWVQLIRWDTSDDSFRDNRTVLLNHHPHLAIPHKDHKPHRLKVIPNRFARGEDAPIYHKRLVRDGWALVSEGPDIWEKPDSGGKHILVMLVGIDFKHQGGYYALQRGQTCPGRIPCLGGEVGRQAARSKEAHGRPGGRARRRAGTIRL